MVNVAVVGAAGYAGIEAVRLVLGHPRLRLALATSGAEVGHPGSAGAGALEFIEHGQGLGVTPGLHVVRRLAERLQPDLVALARTALPNL